MPGKEPLRGGHQKKRGKAPQKKGKGGPLGTHAPTDPPTHPRRKEGARLGGIPQELRHVYNGSGRPSGSLDAGEGTSPGGSLKEGRKRLPTKSPDNLDSHYTPDDAQPRAGTGARAQPPSAQGTQATGRERGARDADPSRTLFRDHQYRAGGGLG